MDLQKELIAEFDRESTTTRKVLDAIPDTVDFTWKPHEKARAIGLLAKHVADTNIDWAVHALTLDQLEWNESMTSKAPQSKAELLAGFDGGLSEAKAALAGMTPAKWESHWKFVAGGQTWIDDTKYSVFRTWVLNHTIHHRAQLALYLRLLGAKVPGAYGPSADEM